MTNLTLNDTDANGTNSANRSVDYYKLLDAIRRLDRDALQISDDVIAISIIVLGGSTCLWCLVALLTSPKHRADLKILCLCGILISLLLDAWCYAPLLLAQDAIRESWDFNERCTLHAIMVRFSWIQDFISNWTIFVLLVILLGQLLDFVPQRHLSGRAYRVIALAFPMLPWVFSLLLIPSIHLSYQHKVHSCIYPDYGNFLKVSMLVCSIVPILLSITLLLASAVLRKRRFSAGQSSVPGAATVELLSGGTEVDPIWPYGVIVGLAVVIDAPAASISFRFFPNDVYIRLVLTLIVTRLMALRTVLMPYCLLTIPAVRQRVLTWRPWYRPPPGIDLTVVYSHSAGEPEVKPPDDDFPKL